MDRTDVRSRNTDARIPVTFRWYAGPKMPPISTQEIIFYEDDTNFIGKIIMRRLGRTYVFTSYNAEPGLPSDVTILLDNHAHRHATGGDSLARSDVGADPIGPYTFTWTKAHTWSPASASTTPITINAAASQTADLVKVSTSGGTRIFTVDNTNAVGINEDDPQAHLVVQGTGFDPLTLSPLAWYKADAVGSSQPTNGQTANNWPQANTWIDSSGNSRHMDHTNEPTSLTYNTGVQNGMPSVLLAGDGYFYGSVGMISTAAYTVYSVFKRNGTGGTGSDFALLGDFANNYLKVPRAYIDGLGTNVEELWRVKYANDGSGQSTAVMYANNSPDPDTCHVWTVTKVGASTTHNFRKDGVDKGGISVIAPSQGASDPASWYGLKGIGSGAFHILEIIVYGAVHDPGQIAQVEGYLNSKYNLNGGGSSGTALPLTYWQSSAGTVLAQVDETGQLGVGVDPGTKVHILSTTEQLRLSYDTGGSTDASFTVSSGGDLTIAPDGGDTSITGTLTVSTSLSAGAAGFTVNTTGNLTKINTVTYSWPSSQGSADRYLRNDGSGTLTWAQISLTAGVTGTLPTTSGGTGLSSYTAGDIIYYASGTAFTTVPIGTSGTVLTSTGTAPQWSTLSSAGLAPNDAQYLTLATSTGLTNERLFTPGTGLTASDGGANNPYTLNCAHALLSASHTDTTAATPPTRGDVITGQGAPTASWTRLARGSTDHAFRVNSVGTDVGWGVLQIGGGGTGIATYVTGDILYADTNLSLARLADVATGNALISGGVATAPSWGKIGLTTHVSGTLPTGNGGTGLASYTAGDTIYYASGTAFTKVTIGSAGKLYRSTGTAPAWSTATYPDTAGTPGNNLTSDGTNWVSQVPFGAHTLCGGL